MAWRGITAILSGTKVIKMKYKEPNPRTPTWTKSIPFDMVEKKITEEWKNLREEKENIRSIIKRLDKSISLITIDSFLVNKNIRRVKDLYNFEGDAYTVFKIENNTRGLLVVSAKTVTEMEAVGFNRYNKYYLPLLISINGSSIQLLNSL